jgi:GNAT superfamily N-acetyltransferase
MKTMDGVRRDLKLVICITNEVTRGKFRNLLQELTATGNLTTKIPRYRFEAAYCETRDEATACLHGHLNSGEDSVAILLSDVLVDAASDPTEIDSWLPNSWAKEVTAKMRVECATVAIMRSPSRVRDIDRVIGLNATAEQLLDILKLASEKLSYMALPAKRTLPVAPDIRLIGSCTELLDYFKLRHRIYKIMGYLDEEIENTRSQMEINWCDTTSLHIGAYSHLRNQSELLVGTARLVVASGRNDRMHPLLLSRYGEWVKALAGNDVVLKKAIEDRMLFFQLPIFQSQELSEIFRQAVLRDEVCGELSRVIVVEDYRGAGLSRQLVEFALNAAAKTGINRLFLECLEIHEGLYRRFGFRRIQGSPRTVIGVNQTMIGMELYPLVVVGSCDAQSTSLEA